MAKRPMSCTGCVCMSVIHNDFIQSHEAFDFLSKKEEKKPFAFFPWIHFSPFMLSWSCPQKQNKKFNIDDN